ncbi:MAG: antibiotic ABC transporter ATP-binding protein [Flavobacteriales bacterium]|nr:antibiotic ABC transporter ATP-binding protein [Flavobacteriales bacterium]|tara:strand:+ start:15564 stop:17384 length:1821 start_codon:yes stop_codon:yes gene_type:complete
MKSLLKIVKYIVPYKGLAWLSVVSNILHVIFHLLSILALIPFLSVIMNRADRVTEQPEFRFSSDYVKEMFNYQITPYIDDFGVEGALFYICVIIAILFFLKNLFRYFAKFFLASIRSGVVRDIREQVYSKILVLPLSFYSEEKKGDIISRITGDVQEIEWSIMNSLEMVFRDPISIVMSLIFMLTLNAELTLFAFILLPISGLIIGKIGKSLKRTSSKLQIRMGELLSNVEETLGGLRIIKAFNAEEAANKKFNGINTIYRNTMLRMFRKRDLASPTSEFLGALVMVILVWYGGKMVVDPAIEFSAEEFLGYIAMFSQLLNPAKSLSTAYYNIQKGAASTERIEMVLQAENKIKDKADAQPINTFEDSIEYKNLSFAYEKTKVLKNINLKVSKGKTVALVGQSGGGKSTMVDLLPRFYDPVEGGVFIDGKDIRDYKIKDLRALMGIVSQRSILFNDTIFNNIALGVENPTKEAVIEAAKIANAHDFIEKLPEGYETNIGDGGGKLSGGQQQRISIARAVLKNPPIMILDEATSALDTESEKLVQDALYKLMENRTSIVIAHRLSTIQHADEIVVMQDGEIVERGTHDNLIAQGGVYKKLTDLQAFA